MTSAQRRKKNRLGAQKSTGPITPAGKEASRKGALRHGLTAKTLTLPGENPDEIQAKAERWYAACQPEGPVEEVLVDQIACATLRLERIANAENESRDEQVRNAEIEWDREQKLRLLKSKRLLRRDRATAIIELESFGAGVSWLLGRWKTLESAFNNSRCWNHLSLIREAVLLRGVHEDHVAGLTGSAYEFALLAIACVEGHENNSELAEFLSTCDDEGVPCISAAKSVTEMVRTMTSYVPDVCLASSAVRTPATNEARRTMRGWIERQIAHLHELDRHFREADPKSRAGAKVRAQAPADTPQNRLLLRYMKSAENAFDRAVKTLAKLQKERQKSEANKDGDGPAEAPKTDLRNEATVVGQVASNDLVPGCCVKIRAQDYVVVEKSDGNLILSEVEKMVKQQPQGVAATPENRS